MLEIKNVSVQFSDESDVQAVEDAKKERCDIAASAKEKSITEGNILIQQIF